MNTDKTIPHTWGKSEQKLILVRDNDFTELQAHLENDQWRIDMISSCANSCYVTLEKN